MTLLVVRDYVIQEFLSGESPTRLDPDDPLLSSGIIDSVGAMKLVLFLEERFSIEIDAEDLLDGALDTLNGICALVDAKTGGTSKTCERSLA